MIVFPIEKFIFAHFHKRNYAYKTYFHPKTTINFIRFEQKRVEKRFF